MDRTSIGNLISARPGVSGAGEVTWLPARWRAWLSAAAKAPRRRLEESASALLTEATPAAGHLTDTILAEPPIAAFAGALLGCLTTECIGLSGMAPAIASALATALLCGLLLITRTTSLFAEGFFPAFYGGTFAGMTPIIWLIDGVPGASAASSGSLAVSLSIVCGLAFFAVAKLDTRSTGAIAIGWGGRLGAIAVVASFFFVQLVQPLGADTSRFHTVAADAFDLEPWSVIAGFFACLFGTCATLLALRQPRIAGGSVAARIFVASAAALSGLIVLQQLDPDDAIAIDAFYAGCFLGMSSPEWLKGWLQPVSGALVLTVLLVPVRVFLPGFGGGLGLAALIAVMLLIALSRATVWMTRDMLTGNRRFANAIASPIVAALLTIGLISAEPAAEEIPVSVGTTALASDAASALLVVDRPVPGAADSAIPIGIALINAKADDVVVLSGLPSGSTMTNGRPSMTGGWQLLPRELADAAIRPAHGFAGGANITVELRRHDQSVVDREERHLEWIGAAPRVATAAALPFTGLSADQIPEDMTEDDRAIYRAILQFRGDAGPEPGAVAHPARRAAAKKKTARGQSARGEPAASAGSDLALLTRLARAIRPPNPLARRGDISSRQRAHLP
jgi:hypothetical protein